MMSSGRTPRRFDNFFTGEEREGYGDQPAGQAQPVDRVVDSADEAEEQAAVAA